MKRVITVLYLLILTFSVTAQSAYIPPDKPKLVIGIIVEQLRYDQLERIWEILPDNGLKRMVSEGTNHTTNLGRVGLYSAKAEKILSKALTAMKVLPPAVGTFTHT